MSTEGRYFHVVKLGEGTYGSVYRGIERQTGKVIAFKRMVMSSDEDGVPSTAIREICLLKQLKHENVVELFEVLFDPPKITLIFELCDSDLKRFIDSKENKRLDTFSEVRPILKQIFNGLAYIHSRSVVHRDMKPQNIFVNVRSAQYAFADGSGYYPAVPQSTRSMNDSNNRNGSLASNSCSNDCNRILARATNGGGNTENADRRSMYIISSSSTKDSNHSQSGVHGDETVDTNDTKEINNNGNATYVSTGSRNSESSAQSSDRGSMIIAKLGDFGLARVECIPVKKYLHEAVTLWYRSPDVLMGSGLYSFAVDVWSMGVIFFEMVTGKVLFCGRTEEDQIVRIMRLLGSPTRQTWPSLTAYPRTNERFTQTLLLIKEGKLSSKVNSFQSSAHTSHKSSSSAATKNGKESGSAVHSKGVDVRSCDSKTYTRSHPGNDYHLPSELWFPEPMFDSYIQSSGFMDAVGKNGVDLLRCCLRYEPQHRITAAQALKHPFLADVHIPQVATLTYMMTAIEQVLQAAEL